METNIGFERVFDSLNINRNSINFISMQVELIDNVLGFSNEIKNAEKIIEILKSGEDVFIVSDEGMPGFADPGELIIKTAIKNKINIKVVPGPTVVTCAIAITGCSSNFTFESFLPENQSRMRQFLKDKKESTSPIVLVLRNRVVDQNGRIYFHQEIPQLLLEGCKILGEDREAVLCYNLTKENEKIIRGTFLELYNYFISNPREDDQIAIVIDTQDKRFRTMNTLSSFI